MKLTEDDIGIEQNWTHRDTRNPDCQTFYSICITPIKPYIDHKQAEQLKQQILDDHDLVSFVRSYLTATNLDKGLAFDNIMKRVGRGSKT